MAEYATNKELRSVDVIPESRFFRDIITSFAMHPSTQDVSSIKNQESIKQTIKNLISTVPGEKFYNPRFGSRVRELLFEPLDPFTINELEEDIINTIQNYDNRVVVQTVNVTPDYDQYYLEVDIEYNIVGQPLIEQVSFILEPPVG